MAARTRDAKAGSASKSRPKRVKTEALVAESSRGEGLHAGITMALWRLPFKALMAVLPEVLEKLNSQQLDLLREWLVTEGHLVSPAHAPFQHSFPGRLYEHSLGFLSRRDIRVAGIVCREWRMRVQCENAGWKAALSRPSRSWDEKNVCEWLRHVQLRRIDPASLMTLTTMRLSVSDMPSKSSASRSRQSRWMRSQHPKMIKTLGRLPNLTDVDLTSCAKHASSLFKECRRIFKLTLHTSSGPRLTQVLVWLNPASELHCLHGANHNDLRLTNSLPKLLDLRVTFSANLFADKKETSTAVCIFSCTNLH